MGLHGVPFGGPCAAPELAGWGDVISGNMGMHYMPYWPCAAPELAGWGEQLGGGVERRTVVTPHVRAINGLASVLDISHGQRLQVCKASDGSKPSMPPGRSTSR